MIFYLNHIQGDDDESLGYVYFTSKRAARKDAAERKRNGQRCSQIAEKLEVKPTRKGICRALNRFGGHPDNG